MTALTDRIIRSTPSPAKGRKIITDGHRDAPRGFALRVNANGTRTFVLRYKADGRDRLLTIGDHPTWSLTAARKQAGEYRRQVDQGTDILDARRVASAEGTVAEAVDVFVKTKRGLRSHDDITRVLTKHVPPALARRKIRSVKKHEIIAAVEHVAADHGRTASILLTYLKQLWAWADDRGMVDVDIAAGIKPARISANLRTRPRDRVLSDDEIRTLWTLDQPPEGMSRNTLLALKMILATGQRPGEVCAMRADEVRGRTWTIPASKRKTDTMHLVPLTDTALDLIEQAGGREDVFGGLTVAAVGKAVARCRDALDMTGERWRPHDLRRTARTGLAALGIPEHVAELTIGHSRKGIAATYDQHRYEKEKRTALEQWERRLLRIAAGDEVEDDNVHSIMEGQA